MKNIFTLLIMLLGLSNITILSAQPVNNYTDDVTMPTPTAASLGRFIDNPISSFTGTQPIQVPIYTLQDGSLSMDIGLRYHNGGVKIGQPSGRYGLNWQNTAENSLTVTVQGIPDMGATGYYNAPVTNTDYNTLRDVANGERDSEPDLYSYSLPGTNYSGKFYFENKTAIFIPLADLHVEITGTNAYIITTPEGVRYHYGDFGSYGGVDLIRNSKTPLLNPYPFTYHLAKIESYDRESAIHFEYESETYSYYQKTSCQFVVSLCEGNGTTGTSNKCNLEWSNNEIMGQRLQRITTEDATKTVTFYYSAIREDLDVEGSENAAEIDRIEIETGSGEGEFYRCKKFDFDFDYWVASTSGTGGNDHKRLRLLEVQESSCNDVEVVNPYRFSYVGYNTGTKMTADTAKLPNRMSNAIDHWGFWNGVSANTKPNIPFTVLTISGEQFSYGQSDREANDKYSVSGVLDTIYYPWGGYTAYDYEGNTVKEITETEVDDFFFISDTAVISDPNQCPYIFLDEDTLTMTAEQAATARVEICGYDPDSCDFNPGFNFNIHADSLKSDGDWGFIRTFSWGGQETSCLPQNGTVSLNAFFDYNFVAGTTYRFQLDGSNGGGSFRIYYTETDTINRTVAGVRVAKMVHHDDIDSADDIVYEFDYSDPDDDGWSSGRLMRALKYGYSFVTTGNPSQFSTLVFSDVAIVPLSTLQGYEMGYTRVTQIQPDNGRKVTKYHSQRDAKAITFPYPPLPLNERNGHASAHQTFTEQDTLNPLAAQKIVADGLENELSSSLMYKVRPVSCTGTEDDFYIHNTYAIRTGIFRPQEILDTLENVATKATYTYQNRGAGAKDHLMPLTTSFVGSVGEIVKTQYEYVFDFANQSTDTTLVYARMANELNLISTPVLVTQSVGGDNKVVSGSWTDWRYYEPLSTDPDRAVQLDENAQFNNTDRIPYAYEYFNYEAPFNGNEPPNYSLSHWESAATIDTMDWQVHRPDRVTLDGWETQEYTWSPMTRMLTQSKYQDHIQSAIYYNGTTKLKEATAIDGQYILYDYDDLCRLSQITERHERSNNSPKIVTTLDYQYPDLNNIRAYVRREIDYATAENLSNQSALDQQIIYDYLDGLGRSIQILQQAYAAADAHDIVTVTDYDKRGRVERVYEPFSTNNNTGDFFTGSLIGQPFTRSKYEASPLNRPSSITPPNWLDPTVTTYGANSGNEVEIMPRNGNNGFYAANQLKKQTIIDPEGKFTTTFADKRGRTILLEQGDANNSVKTYYEYDEKDRERFIYPPGSSTSTSELIFEKRYDAADRMVYEKYPDKEFVEYAYDNRDLLVAMQDGMMRNYGSVGRHLVNAYDEYGRVVATGFSNNDIPSQPTITLPLTENYYDGQSDTSTETDPIYIGKIRKMRTKLLDGEDVGTDWMEMVNTYNEYGQLTQTRANNPLDASLNSDIREFKYDFADNLLQCSRQLFTNTTAIENLVTENNHHYDHQGRKIKEFHQVNSNAIVQLCEQDYTDKDLPNQKKIGKVGGNFLQTVNYSYNARRWLTSINDPETLGDDLFALELKYKFPTSGFSQADAQKNGNISQQIWKTATMTDPNQAVTYGYQYDFLDRLTDATYGEVDYGTTFRSNNNPTINVTNDYNSDYEYDVRGNIRFLNRRGQLSDGTYGTIDQLVYHPNDFDITNQIQFISDGATVDCPLDDDLTGNQNEDLCVEVEDFIISDQAIGNGANVIYRAGESITLNAGFSVVAGSEFLAEVRPCRNKFAGFVDGSGAYGYDENGNMTDDPDKDITVKYNHLNKPYQVNYTDGRQINWLYDAAGTKWQKTTSTGLQQDYLQEVEYVGLKLDAIYHSEGRIAFTNGIGEYQYFLKDHLGNNRILFKEENGAAKIVQENHFYSFGMEMNGVWSSASLSNYLYNGKELDSDFGLGWYHYGFRIYDPVIGRFTGVDPLTDDSEQLDKSPFAYAWNNPIRYTDPFGLKPEDDYKLGKSGKLTLLRKTDANTHTIYNADESASIEVEKSVIDDMSNKNYRLQGAKVTVGLSGTLDPEKGMEVFKFFADNTEVEFGLTIFDFGEGSKDVAILSTSYDKKFNAGQPVFEKMLLEDHQDALINESWHNHPNLKELDYPPSGFYSDGTPLPNKYGDRKFYLDMKKVSKSRTPSDFHLYRPYSGTNYIYNDKMYSQIKK